MLDAAAISAVRRVAERANDVLAGYAPGGIPLHGDVRRATVPVPDADPLACVAPPGAWFAGVDGAGIRRYTRAGPFQPGPDGTLRGPAGDALLGYPAEAPAGPPEPLRLPEPDRSLGRCNDLRIESDGTVAYTRGAIDPRTREQLTERVAVGRLALARFPAGTEPQRLDGAHVAAPPGIVPYLGRPADGTFGPLATAARDTGGLDLDAGLARLADAYLALRAVHAAQRADVATAKVALDLVK